MEVICPTQCRDLLAKKQDVVLLDIREKYEFDSCHIDATHIPMGEIDRISETISKEKQVILMCQSGRRAEALGNFLETELGYQHVFIMEGGIKNWKDKIDPSLQLD